MPPRSLPTEKVMVRIRKDWFEHTKPCLLNEAKRYVIFGEARKWVIEHMKEFDLGSKVLDVGSGQGLFALEIAARMISFVLGIDIFKRDSIDIAKSLAAEGKITDKVDWVQADGQKMPLKNECMDAVMSFMSLQDIYALEGFQGISRVTRESCRVLKTQGVLGIADNLFPECAINEPMKTYYDIFNEFFHVNIPSKKSFASLVERNGVDIILEELYDPTIDLNVKEARAEFLVATKAMESFGIFARFENLWRDYEVRIRRGVSYPLVMLLIGRKRA